MITDNDIYWEKDKKATPFSAIGFGLDGVLVFDFPSYVDFYELLTTSDSVVNTTDDYTMIDFIKDGVVVETLHTSEMLGSLICSSPDILELFREGQEEKAYENRKVITGWLYDEDGNFTFPEVFPDNLKSPYEYKQTS